MSEKLAGTRKLGDKQVYRMGFGAMRLAGPMVYGPPRNPEEAKRVIRTAIEAGVNHMDTSDFYGPHVVNQMLREVLSPYPEDLVLVTKVGARRTPDKAWHPALSPDELRSAVDDNLRNLGVEALEVVNLRVGTGQEGPQEDSIAEQFGTLLELQKQGKIKHLGMSNCTLSQLREALDMGPVVCVQNSYGVLNQADDDLLAYCETYDIAFVPFFPLGGGFKPLRDKALSEVATEVGATPHQVALAWLLHRSPNMLLIPGTSQVAHLQLNLAAAELKLDESQMQRLTTA